jgi:hypothetical protein
VYGECEPPVRLRSEPRADDRADDDPARDSAPDQPLLQTQESGECDEGEREQSTLVTGAGYRPPRSPGYNDAAPGA